MSCAFSQVSRSVQGNCHTYCLCVSVRVYVSVKRHTHARARTCQLQLSNVFLLKSGYFIYLRPRRAFKTENSWWCYYKIRTIKLAFPWLPSISPVWHLAHFSGTFALLFRKFTRTMVFAYSKLQYTAFSFLIFFLKYFFFFSGSVTVVPKPNP